MAATRLRRLNIPVFPVRRDGDGPQFYDEYYFRPKAVFRIVRKAVFNSEERQRLYKEASHS